MPRCAVTGIGACLETVTHSWTPQDTTFYVCERHAEVYNSGGRTDYRPLQDLRLEHPNILREGDCTGCGRRIHRCQTHSQIACSRALAGGEACLICYNCFRETRHRHCNVCNSVASWVCDDCGECCGPSTEYSSEICARCYDLRVGENDSEDEEDDYRRSGYIHEYHGYEVPKARPTMFRSLHKGRPYLWLGVELECEMEDRNERSNAAEAIAREFGEASEDPYVVMAEDGSLNSGFETITGPMSLQHHKELWPKLAPFMAKQGLRSWKHSTTGMHVHVSRNFFSQLEIGKMLVFLNSRKTYDNVTKLAGRKENHYAQIKPKKLSSAYNGENDDRYNALNTTNSRTLEFRIFKGTLKTGHILANLEFVHALCMYVKQSSVRVMEDWPMFWQYVLKNRREYSNLVAFFDQSMEEMAA